MSLAAGAAPAPRPVEPIVSGEAGVDAWVRECVWRIRRSTRHAVFAAPGRWCVGPIVTGETGAVA